MVTRSRMDSMKDYNLDNIHVGDFVYFESYNYSTYDYTKCKVVHETKTQIEIALNSTHKKFMRGTGKAIGESGWHISHIYPVTPDNEKIAKSYIDENIEKDHRRAMIAKIRDTRFVRLSTEALEQICATIDNSKQS